MSFQSKKNLLSGLALALGLLIGSFAVRTAAQSVYPFITLAGFNSGAPVVLSVDASGNVNAKIVGGAPPVFTAGTGTGTGKTPIYLLHSETAFTCTAADSGVTAATLTLPANSMITNGDRIFIHAEGTTSAAANSRTATLSFGATTSGNLTSATTAAQGWVIDAWVTRTGATTQLMSITGNMNNLNGVIQSNPSPAETLSGTIAIVIKESCPTAADFTFRAMHVVLYPA